MIVVALFKALDQWLQTDLAPDWAWWSLQTGLLLAIFLREVLRAKGRNLYALLMIGTMLVLIEGQGWWMLSRFQERGATEARQLLHIVSLDGARLANFYFGLGILCFAGAYWVADCRMALPAAAPRTPAANPPAWSYLAVGGWTLGAGTLLVALLGGLQQALSAPGREVAGQTVFLVAIGLGKLPLLRKIVVGARFHLGDYTLFALTFLLTLLNSRFLSAFLLLQVGILLNYCWREISRRAMLALVGVLFVIFIIFGLYREFNNRLAAQGGFNADALQVVLGNQLLPGVADWFYGLNVEGFGGLAGILTQEDYEGGLDHDYGLSTLRVVLQFVPNQIRTDPDSPLAGVLQRLVESYPYQGSVVPPGFEMAYAHFGLPGILLLGLGLGWLAQWLHRRMADAAADRLRIGVASVHTLQLIRGTFITTIFFVVAELVMLALYRWILRLAPAPGDPPAVSDRPPGGRRDGEESAWA